MQREPPFCTVKHVITNRKYFFAFRSPVLTYDTNFYNIFPPFLHFLVSSEITLTDNMNQKRLAVIADDV